MSNTQLTVLPQGVVLPAHLQTPEIAAQIAAANAAAAGGVRAGMFPQINIKAGKFHIVEGGETQTLTAPPSAPGQPPLPLMCLEVVIVDANPMLSKVFFQGKYVEGETREPDCRSVNGTVPDTDAPNKQSAVCATCPQYQWGSKVSEISGKDIRACDDYKQLAVLPAGDLGYKALGMPIRKGSLSNWGKYVQVITGRGWPIFGLVTNITFDATQTGVLNFSFNRFLTEDELAKVRERTAGDDVKAITAQSRALSVALPAPATQVALPPPAPSVPPAIPPHTPAPTPPVPATPPLATMAFAASPTPATAPVTEAPASVPTLAPTLAPALATTPAPARRTRRTRAQIEADNAAKNAPPPSAPFQPPVVDLSYLPPTIAAAVAAVGPTSPAGQALLAQFPAQKVEGTLVGAPAQVAPSVVPSTPPTPTATPSGFGAGTVPTQTPTATVNFSALNLKKVLAEKLGLAPDGSMPA